MKKPSLLLSLIFFFCAAVAAPSGDEYTCTMKFTDLQGSMLEMSVAKFEFRLGSRVLVQATPTSFRRSDELTAAPAQQLSLILTKGMDETSAKLSQAMRSKTKFPTVELALMGTVGDKQIQVTYHMSDVIVSRIAPIEGGEALTLNFEELKQF